MIAEPPPLSVRGYVIAPELFTLGYPTGHGPCACDASCCKRGAYVDVLASKRILAHRDLIKQHMDESQTQDETRWFEHEQKPDPDFASGSCVGTAERNGKCVFLNGRGWCSLQVAASAAGLHRWALKPTYCVLYPIEVCDRVIKFDRRLQGERACCTVQSEHQTPLFEACRDELEHLLGEPGWQALRAHYLAHYRGPSPAPIVRMEGDEQRRLPVIG